MTQYMGHLVGFVLLHIKAIWWTGGYLTGFKVFLAFILAVVKFRVEELKLKYKVCIDLLYYFVIHSSESMMKLGESLQC